MAEVDQGQNVKEGTIISCTVHVFFKNDFFHSLFLVILRNIIHLFIHIHLICTAIIDCDAIFLIISNLLYYVLQQ